MEKGERAENAARRECLEESGIRTKSIGLCGVYSNPRRDPRGHVVSLVFLLKPLNSKTRTSKETSDVRFFPISKVPKNLAADHSKILRDALIMMKNRTAVIG